MRDDAPDGLDDPSKNPDDGRLRARVMPAALLLLIVNVLNLLAGVHFLFDAIAAKKGDADVEARTQKLWDDYTPQQREIWANFGITTAHDVAICMANFLLGWGGVMSLVAVVGLLGAIRMRSLHSYGLALLGAATTAIPCVTPCCLVGQIAGIWAIVVLLNPEVRKAFQ
jgi:hypothetical protein